MRVAVPRQPALGLAGLPGPACPWGGCFPGAGLPLAGTSRTDPNPGAGVVGPADRPRRPGRERAPRGGRAMTGQTSARASVPTLLLSTEKVTALHRSRDAYVYVRQSTPSQMIHHTESLARQYELRERAVMLGWPAHQVVVIDADLGRSGAQSAGRTGFKELVADVGLGKAGIVLGIE